MKLRATAKDVVGTRTAPNAFRRHLALRAWCRSVCALLLPLALLAASAGASQPDLAALPTQPDFGCLSCHNGPSATATTVPVAEATQLNLFGRDWLRGGRVWNATLAHENSDGDGCSNGYELGDPAGDWQPSDGYLPVPPAELRNPGEPGDCLLPIGDRSFGILKGLFGQD